MPGRIIAQMIPSTQARSVLTGILGSSVFATADRTSGYGESSSRPNTEDRSRFGSSKTSTSATVFLFITDLSICVYKDWKSSNLQQLKNIETHQRWLLYLFERIEHTSIFFDIVLGVGKAPCDIIVALFNYDWHTKISYMEGYRKYPAVSAGERDSTPTMGRALRGRRKKGRKTGEITLNRETANFYLESCPKVCQKIPELEGAICKSDHLRASASAYGCGRIWMCYWWWTTWAWSLRVKPYEWYDGVYDGQMPTDGEIVNFCHRDLARKFSEGPDLCTCCPMRSICYVAICSIHSMAMFQWPELPSYGIEVWKYI